MIRDCGGDKRLPVCTSLRRTMKCWKTFLLHALIGIVTSNLSCKNENGKSVDWLIVYKLPPAYSTNSRSSFFATGESYAYLSADEIHKTGKWILSAHSIASKASSIAKTLNSITKSKDISYLVYNDELPDKNFSSFYWGHAKGVFAFDGKTGYWLIHSVPKFPIIGHYQFPVGSKEHGQMFICVTYNFSTINKIGNQLLYMKPRIYMWQASYIVSKLSPSVQSLFSRHPSFISKPPWYNNAHLLSKNGISFLSFSKHSKFHEDLYSALVAPTLKSSLYTETWQNGKGIPLISDCSIPYPVWNVRNINITLYYKKQTKDIKFVSEIDHSKWAVSAKYGSRWTCIGDINRMKSQEKRGGGTLCFKLQPVWKNFHSAVSAIEECEYRK